MRRILSLLLLAPGLLFAQSRELVPNGSFEEVSARPKTWDQLKLAMGWTNVSLGLSEVFDKDAPAKTVGIPANDYGSIEPKEGDRFAGFFAWKDDHKYNHFQEGDQNIAQSSWNVYAEYLQVELKERLVEGKTYRMTFHVALAQNSDRAVSGIGAYFSEIPLRYQHRRFLQEKAQVFHDTIIKEKGKWVEITGEFEADGGEVYLIVGVFPYGGFYTEKVVEGPDNQYAYYYVDHISVKEVVPEEEGAGSPE